MAKTRHKPWLEGELAYYTKHIKREGYPPYWTVVAHRVRRADALMGSIVLSDGPYSWAEQLMTLAAAKKLAKQRNREISKKNAELLRTVRRFFTGKHTVASSLGYVTPQYELGQMVNFVRMNLCPCLSLDYGRGIIIGIRYATWAEKPSWEYDIYWETKATKEDVEDNPYTLKEGDWISHQAKVMERHIEPTDVCAENQLDIYINSYRSLWDGVMERLDNLNKKTLKDGEELH